MLKAGFIGFGRMGMTHFSILSTHPSVEIASACDHSATMMNILSQYNKVHTFSNYNIMIADVPLDFVVISTATDSHSEIINYCLERKLHVFVEKPFALSTTDAFKTLAYLDGKKLVNQVGYVNRFNEVFIEVRRLLEEGLIGEIKSFSSEMYAATVLKDSKNGWRGKKKTGGGCMYEIASHCIDLAVYFFGMPDRVAGSCVKSVYSSSVDDMVCSTFIYQSGLSGTVTTNWCDEAYRKPTNIVKVFGTKGKIVADRHGYRIYLKEADLGNGFQKGWNTRYITDFGKSVRFYLRGNEFTNQLDYFVDCIEKGRRDNISSFSEAVKTDILIDEITRDAAESSALVSREYSTTAKEGLKRKSFLGRFWG